MSSKAKRNSSHLDTIIPTSSHKRSHTLRTSSPHRSSIPNLPSPSRTSDSETEIFSCSSDSSSTHSSPRLGKTQIPVSYSDEETSSSGSDSSSIEEISSSKDDHSDSEDESQGDDSSASKKKPTPDLRATSEKLASLRSRITALLPEMELANEELEREKAEGRLEERDIETLDDEGSYIEMNLGLGVLEEKREKEGNGSGSEDDEEYESDNSDEEQTAEAEGGETGAMVEENDGSEPGHSGPNKRRRKEQDAMRQLKGQEKCKIKPSIQVQ